MRNERQRRLPDDKKDAPSLVRDADASAASEDPRPEPDSRLSCLSLSLLSFSGGPNGTHVRRSPAVKKGTGAHTEAAPTHRRCARSSGQCQFEWRITHDVGSREAQDQSGAEGAMGEAQGEAEADDLGGREKADRSGAESTVGKGEARGLKGNRTELGR